MLNCECETVPKDKCVGYRHVFVLEIGWGIAKFIQDVGYCDGERCLSCLEIGKGFGPPSFQGNEFFGEVMAARSGFELEKVRV